MTGEEPRRRGSVELRGLVLTIALHQHYNSHFKHSNAHILHLSPQILPSETAPPSHSFTRDTYETRISKPTRQDLAING